MDDTQNGDKNQDSPQLYKPEEVAAGIESPEEISGSIPPDFENVPVYEEKGNKFAFIAGIIVVFILIFGGIVWFFFRDRIFGPTPPIITTKDPVTLTYWGLWDEEDVYKGVFDEYTKKNPHVTIKYEMMAPEQYKDRLLARSKTKNGPDIYRFHNTWIPQIRDVLTEIPAEILTPAEFEETFYPIHAKDLKIGAGYYGIPLMVDGNVLIYNEALLRQAGITSPPAVWVGQSNDVLSAVNTLTVRDSTGSIITAGMAIGTASNVEHFGEIFGILLLLNGGDLKQLDQSEAAEALQLYRSFAEDNYWSEAMPNSVPAFIEGKVAMVIAPSWHIINIKAKNPDLSVKVAPIPKGLNGTTVSVANYWVEGVNKNNPNQGEAWNLLKFMMQKESLTKIYQVQAAKRPFGSPYSRVDMAELLSDNEYLSVVIGQAKADQYVSLPLVDRTHDAGLNDDILQYVRNAINETSRGVGYESALRTAQLGIRQVFERYQIE